MKQLSLFEPTEVPLTRGHYSIVDPIDADLLDFNWQLTITNKGKKYASRRKKKGKEVRTIWLHRVVLSRMVGRSLLPTEFADHIDGDSLNNRRSNLRIADSLGNSQNARMRKDNTSGYKGVTKDKDKDKWRSQIFANRKKFHLGYFDTAEQAYAAYCKAAKEMHGEFARLK